MRRVASITRGEDTWRHDGVPQDTTLDDLEIELPDILSGAIIDFARRHIGPGATEPEIRYFCHTFAQHVGETALESMLPDGEGLKRKGASQASSVVELGSRVKQEDIAVGEHVAVGQSKETRPYPAAASHSLVGLGNGLGIQVDGPREGDLYIGHPQNYADWLRDKHHAEGHEDSDPGLYVHRTPPPTN